MRRLATYDGIIEHDHVRLPPSAGIPEQTEVYVLARGTDQEAHVVSPQLTNPQQAKDFQMLVIED